MAICCLCQRWSSTGKSVVRASLLTVSGTTVSLYGTTRLIKIGTVSGGVALAPISTGTTTMLAHYITSPAVQLVDMFKSVNAIAKTTATAGATIEIYDPV